LFIGSRESYAVIAGPQKAAMGLYMYRLSVGLLHTYLVFMLSMCDNMKRINVVKASLEECGDYEWHQTPTANLGFFYDDSLEGEMAADPLKNKMMLNKSTNFCSKSFFWCSRCKSVDR
jgi:hypothetical protein